MDLTKLENKERYSKLYWNASTYYDYPDGQDLIGKLLFTNKIAWVAGSFFGLLGVGVYRPLPTTFQGKVIRYLQCVLPCLGAATAFTCVTYFSTKIRQKDDQVNYVLGGVAAGLSLIPPTGNIGFGALHALLFGLIGYSQKNAKMHNKELLPTPVRGHPPPYYERKLDTSLEPNTRKGNWTK